MTGHQFRVTVEDLATGERQIMEFAPGDYVLIPFAPCHRVGVDAHPIAGTHVITIGGHRPQLKHRVVDDGTTPPPGAAHAGGPAPVDDMHRMLQLAAQGTLGDAISVPLRLSTYESNAVQLAQREGILDGVELTEFGRRLLALLSARTSADG